MPIPVTCAKCGYAISAPDHVAGRTLRCFKCLAPFTVPKIVPAPVAQFAPPATPVPAALVPAPPAQEPAFPEPTLDSEPDLLSEFEVNEEPLLLESGPAPTGAAGGDQEMELLEEEIEFLDDEPPKGSKPPGK